MRLASCSRCYNSGQRQTVAKWSWPFRFCRQMSILAITKCGTGLSRMSMGRRLPIFKRSFSGSPQRPDPLSSFAIPRHWRSLSIANRPRRATRTSCSSIGFPWIVRPLWDARQVLRRFPVKNLPSIAPDVGSGSRVCRRTSLGAEGALVHEPLSNLGCSDSAC